MSRAWSGFFADIKHGVRFRLSLEREPAGTWYIGMHHFKDSAVLAMKVVLEPLPGHRGEVWVRPLVGDAPVLLPILFLGGTQASCFEFRSWATQLRMFPRVAKVLKPEVRAFFTNEQGDILKVAARSGWWSLGNGVLGIDRPTLRAPAAEQHELVRHAARLDPGGAQHL